MTDKEHAEALAVSQQQKNWVITLNNPTTADLCQFFNKTGKITNRENCWADPVVIENEFCFYPILDDADATWILENGYSISES